MGNNFVNGADVAKSFFLCLVQMGYGSRALKALNSFYSGEYFNLSENSLSEPSYPDVTLIDPVRLSPRILEMSNLTNHLT